MAELDVTCRRDGDGWTCQVDVAEAGTRTEHRVMVRSADLARLAPGAGDPVDLVRRSFAFLLEREPKESILRSFDLTMIGQYFPEWEGRIVR